MFFLRLAAGLLAVSCFAQDTASFRIRFGLTDTAPTRWDGAVSVSGGELKDLRSWRPREADAIDGVRSWKLATTPGVKFGYRNWEPEPSSPVPDYINHVGLFLTVAAGSDARVDIRTEQGYFSFRLSDVPPGSERKYLRGAVSLDRAAPAGGVSGRDHHNGFADVAAEENGAYWVAWIGYRGWANQVFARRFDGTKWGAVKQLTREPGDVYYVRLIRDGTGNVHAVWSNQVENNFDLYASRLSGGEWTAPERLTTAPHPDIHHVLAADAQGRVWLAWQGFRNGKSQILARRYGNGSWSAEELVSTAEADHWHPALAADSKGGMYVAWDTYARGDYDVVMRYHSGTGWGNVIPIAETPRYEAYPSIVCDRQDRLWAAWNESDMQWGKDTGFLVRRPATQLYQTRWMALAAYENGQWRTPVSKLEQSLPAELQQFNDFPRLQTDGAGRLWVLFRHRLLRQREVPPTAASHRAAWESFAVAFDGREWLKPVALPVSQGRSDAGFGFSRAPNGELYAAWATDNRIYDEYLYEHGEVFASKIPPVSGTVFPMRLEARKPEKLTIFTNHPAESDDLARIRNYEIRSNGKIYRIYRGDTHRHTEYSADGNNDGSQNDTYRYAMNAADLDYLGMSEHHNGGGPNVEYINWLLQQRVDVFTVPGRFVPLYGYERGLGYPQGHRNVMFAKRGNPTFPTLPNEDEVGAKPLFEYLKRLGGISIPHTSATGMGTDWRDNDPEAEPLVEIYQGDRVSAEYEGAPKAATASDVTSQAGGFRPLGYVWNAWAKGYKLGVQASSDHLSTHISYSCTIAEEFTRDGLMDAMKKRHNYAATDNIVLDYRMVRGGKEYLQGDIVPGASGAYELKLKVLGTAPIRQIDIIRGNEFIYTAQNKGREVSISFTDQSPPAGETFYYVRVQQVNDQIAWSSPIWITPKAK